MQQVRGEVSSQPIIEGGRGALGSAMPKPYTAALRGPLLKSEPQKGQSTITYEMKKIKRLIITYIIILVQFRMSF